MILILIYISQVKYFQTFVFVCVFKKTLKKCFLETSPYLFAFKNENKKVSHIFFWGARLGQTS